MCVGCRQRAGIADLVRVVADTATDRPTILVDFARTEPGRGAWLHPRGDCVSIATRRRAFGSALRVSGLAVAPEDLTALLGENTNDDGSPSEPE